VTRSTPTEHTEPLPTSTIEGAIELVREHGGRVTPSRRLLLQALFGSHRHRSAEDLAVEVQTHAPDIHLSTIYRNLDELEKLGVVTHTHVGHGPATYHLTTSVHGHFVCGECGKMFEAPQALFAELAKAADASYGFTIDPHHFAVLGRCAECS
jgi:Fur family ferric uptake transcriptional regulator